MKQSKMCASTVDSLLRTPRLPQTHSEVICRTMDACLILIGDSDIVRWPESLWPSIGQRDTRIVGRSGATISDLVTMWEELQQQRQQQQHRLNNSTIDPSSPTRKIYVFCAGENDIGADPIWKSEESIQRILHSFTTCGEPGDQDSYWIYLGPKLEPWLDQDIEARKQYQKMSRMIHRILTSQASSSIPVSNRWIFIDCLLLFCDHDDSIADHAVWHEPDTTDCAPDKTNRSDGNHPTVRPSALPGAIYKARPNPIYFDCDHLHLSNEGYRVWKRKVEDCIRRNWFPC